MRTSPHDETPDPRCVTAAIAFDFEQRSEERLSFADALRATDLGRFVWIDVLASDVDEARRALRKLDLFDQEVIEAALTGEPSTLCGRYESYLHIVISGCKPLGSSFELERVDLLISERVFVTVHRTPVDFLAEVWKDYKSDFVRFARSPSFLVYEVWARLVESYLNVQKIMEERVEAVQLELRAEPVDPGVFMRFSELGADLLHFRKIVRPARTVLSDLTQRRSAFLSEVTQGFLSNLMGTVEHVLQDLLVDRDVLSESLHLYMSMVGHRTNEVTKKLTVVSVIFLPLSFLAGVYGMNFEHLPELGWHHGYAMFWTAVILIAGSLIAFLKRARAF